MLQQLTLDYQSNDRLREVRLQEVSAVERALFRRAHFWESKF